MPPPSVLRSRAEQAREKLRAINQKLRINLIALRKTMQEMNQTAWPMQIPAFQLAPALAVCDPIADAVQRAVDRCKDSNDYRVCVSEFIFKLVEDGWTQADANCVTKPALEGIRAHRATS